MNEIAIHTQGLTKTYGDTDAVRSLDLTVRSGEVFGLLGHNGAGKTTTVTMLTTLLEPTSGGIEIGGVDALTAPDDADQGPDANPNEPGLQDADESGETTGESADAAGPAA